MWKQKHINQAVRNNKDKFPIDFLFEFTDEEFVDLRSNFLTSKFAKTRANPKVFTEQGIYMLATILKSKVATSITISLIRTFAAMRKVIANNENMQSQIHFIMQKQISDKLDSENKINQLFSAIESRDIKVNQGIYYDSETYDAYLFVTNLIKNAKNSIILIDNYIDETVLTMLSKRMQNCKAIIYTSKIEKHLQLDIEKHNSQYPVIAVNVFKKAHDRFLILDNKEVYHIGASIKDLGKKWFAFTKLEIDALDILNKLK